MNILIIQLARLGDILLTWPQVRALKRQYPDAKIDMLVRPKFKTATEGLSELNQVIEFPIENIFEPLLKEPLHVQESLTSLHQIITDLKGRTYQWIINATLSPASSYLTFELQTPETKITGYTRTSDGYLNIKDDVSTYFYAQVGVDRENRIHLADLFTMMAEQQPHPDDWKTQVQTPSPLNLEAYIVLHVGASRDNKKFSPFKWRTFITHFQKLSSIPIVLIGNSDETHDADFIALGFNPDQVLNKTGELNFSDLFPLIARAALYIGCDSAPLHIASLVNTPALNVSFATVNFWETGPRSNGSRVLYALTEADLPSETVATEAFKILTQAPASSENIITLVGESPSYQAPPNTRTQDWSWHLLKALYMNEPWPKIKNKTIQQGLQNLLEVNQVILEQFQTIKKTRNVSVVSGIIERCEEVIENIGALIPELRSLIRWYQTQKALIGPNSPQMVFEATEKVHTDFSAIIQYWLTLEPQPLEGIHESSQS